MTIVVNVSHLVVWLKLSPGDRLLKCFAYLSFHMGKTKTSALHSCSSFFRFSCIVASVVPQSNTSSTRAVTSPVDWYYVPTPVSFLGQLSPLISGTSTTHMADNDIIVAKIIHFPLEHVTHVKPLNGIKRSVQFYRKQSSTFIQSSHLTVALLSNR